MNGEILSMTQCGVFRGTVEPNRNVIGMNFGTLIHYGHDKWRLWSERIERGETVHGHIYCKRFDRWLPVIVGPHKKGALVRVYDRG